MVVVPAQGGTAGVAPAQGVEASNADCRDERGHRDEAEDSTLRALLAVGMGLRPHAVVQLVVHNQSSSLVFLSQTGWAEPGEDPSAPRPASRLTQCVAYRIRADAIRFDALPRPLVSARIPILSPLLHAARSRDRSFIAVHLSVLRRYSKPFPRIAGLTLGAVSVKTGGF